ncbi:hydrogenase formation protein HypD [Clostridium sp. PL3]|uniref:Hydrogenase formation protein HypD n=1 Tax=Clostridium thailandense TaxID=2794346 RepID=A0A949TW00_9CLOT|nr:hydrogenase formation protein HypD [Clostridium thailandense]MBV7271364.1 hydrogenase formation protein HypD [Clostridium thailandense]
MNSKSLISKLIKDIQASSVEGLNIMEVCGTHTQAISKLGIRELVFPKINLLSGPGCPVCVTPISYIDAAIELLNKENVILATFGDLMRVRGTSENLINQREKGKKIQIIYSPLDVLKIAKDNRNAEVVFLAVGFETTAPLVALSIETAKKNNINNVSFFTSLKSMKPVMDRILKDKHHQIGGIICPGHVAVVKGAEYFRFISEEYNIPAVVAGFEALDILGAIHFLVHQHNGKKRSFENLYKRCVTPQGNLFANKLMEQVFSLYSSEWRSIGNIEKSAFYIKDKYEDYDSLKKFDIEIKGNTNDQNCICSEILLGRKLPNLCRLFGTSCKPESPIGPCMVSSEGSCAVFYKYQKIRNYITY